MKTKAVEHVLEFGSRRISYRLHRTNRKRLRIIVSPELTVDVSAPETISDEQVY